jgi:hypothetical protein
VIAALTLEMMRARLRQDVDFKRVPTLLEEKVAEMNARPDRACFFESHYLPKFWCLLAWIEQYWTDSKRLTCEQCDYTLPTLRATFPVALATACPGTHIHNFMQRSLDHVEALRAIGRDGDFSPVPSLCHTHKGHRRAELMRQTGRRHCARTQGEPYLRALATSEIKWACPPTTTTTSCVGFFLSLWSVRVAFAFPFCSE